eukprot:CAMPEP_0184022420 /NCGR_PEP_ID=MMETSP0954-20121128/10593_1 /TAXON_ID=627963 /ORGANISM="Aplanochytrium sp, Strain PBS07" /LENGTH=302 /DNA_ID=CAMNT_0026304787 /DNA_START=14 /DNA_END=919 /DNA_ORIENTATION=-
MAFRFIRRLGLSRACRKVSNRNNVQSAPFSTSRLASQRLVIANHRYGRSHVLGALSFGSCVAVLGSSRLHCDDDPLVRLDDLFEKRGNDGNLATLFEELEQLHESQPDLRPKLCFRLARCAYNLRTSKDPKDARLCGSSEKKKVLGEKCLKYAQEALKLCPEDYKSSYWCGIAIQAVGEAEGTKYTISNLNVIRAHFEKAAELNPKDGTTHYCIGQWCYSLADLGWVSRKLAETLFASPPKSTFEEALHYFSRAEEVEPGFWNKNVLFIAKSHEKLGQKDKAAEWAKKCMERPCSNPEDEDV